MTLPQRQAAEQVGVGYVLIDPATAAELRAARLRLGLLQRQLAKKVGVERSFISKLEHAVSAPSRRVAANLTRVLLLDGETARELQRVAETVEDAQRMRRAVWHDEDERRAGRP